MEKVEKFKLEYIYPPNPQTSRGFNSHIDCNAAKNKIVYCVANVVILRDADDLSKMEVFAEHKNETTCARFSPNGNYVCSADVKGGVIIWETEGNHPIKKAYENMLSGAIKDIAWTSDNQRILVVGEGKNNFAKAFILDSGSSVGEIINNSKKLNAGDIRPIKPYRLAVGGEETIVCYYEGPPFKYKKANKGHTGFVNCLRFSPKGNFFVSCGHDKKIILYEADTGNEIKVFDHQGQNHEGAINFCSWFEESNTFITASNDKSLKIWDAESGLCLKTLKTSKNPQIEDFQVSVGLIKDKIYSLSLSGAINFWKYSKELPDGELPLNSVTGHQGVITQVLYNELNDVLISGDHFGRIIIWKDNIPHLLKGKPSTKGIKKIVESADKNILFVISDDAVMKVVDVKEQAVIKEAPAREKEIINLVSHKQQANGCYVIYEDNLVIYYEDLEPKKEIKLAFSPKSGDVSYSGETIALGDSEGTVHQINISSGETIMKKTLFSTKVTVVKYAHDDKFLALGETGYKIMLLDETGKSLTEKLVFHTATITSLTFSKSNNYLLSTSMDNSFIVWNLENHQIQLDAKNLHKNGVNVGAIGKNGTIITGGNDKLIKVCKPLGVEL